MIFDSLRERLLYETLRIRKVEERIVALYPSDRIQSPVHLSIGQEAVAVGTCAALEPDDLVFGSYRSHAFYLAKGGDLARMMAELFGKSTGCGSGKAGSMHLAAPEVGFMGSSAVVASTIPHAVGAALAARRRGRKQVVVAVFGDGATEEGVYHESLNFAVLHHVPVLFLCENNGLAVHSAITARQAYAITTHASAYGLPVSVCEEGYDPMAVHAAIATALDGIRREGGPRFVECRTLRYMEHVGVGEDWHAGYRPAAAAEAWKARDPLLHDCALAQKWTPVIAQEIEAAVRFAETSPWPDEAALLSDVH